MLNLEQVRQFLYYEARLLDDRQWDECSAATARRWSTGCRRGATMTS